MEAIRYKSKTLNQVISDQYNEIEDITADRDKWKAMALELGEALRERNGYYYQRNVPCQVGNSTTIETDMCRDCIEKRSDKALAKLKEMES